MLPTQERQRLTNSVQMRVPGTTKPAADALIELVELQEGFMVELFNILPTPPYQKGAIIEGEKRLCCDAVKVAMEPKRINEIEKLFRQVVGNETADRILREAKLWETLAAGVPPSPGPLSRGIAASLSASIRNTWEKARAAWNARVRKLGVLWGQRNPINEALINIAPEMEWVQVLNAEGYTLVTDTITRNFLPQIMEIVNNGLVRENPLSWGEIATQLKQQIGVKSRYHWERIVRTEMAKAIETANDRQAKAMGVPFQKWSASILSANICAQCSALNGNIYEVGKAPARPVHPNCRCTLIPTWEKPKG